MALVEGVEYPDDLYYDVDNQIWYAPLEDGTLRVGMTPIAIGMAGEILVFTPKRNGHEFERNRWFAALEGGKWAGSARAAFDGVVVESNERLVARPSLLGEDAFGAGWMLIVRPGADDWRAGLVTGARIAPAFAGWLADEGYRGRAD